MTTGMIIGLRPDFDQLVRFLPAVEPVEDGSDIGG